MPSYAGRYSGTWRIAGERGTWTMTVATDGSYATTDSDGATSSGLVSASGVLAGTDSEGSRYRLTINPRTGRVNGTFTLMGYRGTVAGRRVQAFAKTNFGVIDVHTLAPMVSSSATDLCRFPDMADTNPGTNLAAGLMSNIVAGDQGWLVMGS